MSDDERLTYQNQGNTGLLDLLSSSSGRILDCGCGAGDNARILNRRGWRVTAVTIDPREEETARQFCEAVCLGDLENGLPQDIEGTFDAVLASHVLEHLAKPERLLQELRQRLNPGGVIAVALPNIAHYSPRISFLRGRFNYTETGQFDRTHLRFYTYRTAIQLLQQNGYKLVNVVVEGTLPWWKARRLTSISVVARFDEWAVRRWPNLFGYQNLLLARPINLQEVREKPSTSDLKIK
jgi:2-polyprenyl-3-methyl-5-hydroxy-6-metoxy-1,4-benzoquinol methylase